MNVGDICQHNVVTVRPFDELMVAARLMREQHVGYLIVVEPAFSEGTFQPVGVLTDRDLVVSVMAREIDPRSLRVGDVMTREPMLARTDDSIAAALEQMRRIGVRRVPVVGDQGELLGVLSLDDVIHALVSQLGDVAGSIRTEQLIEHVLRP
ncbi:MAG TPA: CBS domain-containing protein [Steroidobacteraceae bacterium]|nr:CBS domain-containing protein [Steroidobacteraceae bacterium]